MDSKKVAEKLRNVEWEKTIDELYSWKWWAITAVLLIAFYPEAFSFVVVVAVISMACSLAKMAKKPKTDFTASENGDVKQEKK